MKGEKEETIARIGGRVCISYHLYTGCSDNINTYLGVKQLDGACHPYGYVIFGHGGARLRIVVLVYVEPTVAATCSNAKTQHRQEGRRLATKSGQSTNHGR